MTRTMSWRVVAVGVIVGLLAFEAAAWGPRGQRAIMSTALQLLRRDYAFEYFDSTEFKFYDDLMRGAADGSAVLAEGRVFTDADAVNAVVNEVQLLREARKHGVGSYYAYRMGALGSLVANLYLPYGLGLEPDANAKDMQTRIKLDTDANIDRYSYKAEPRSMRFIRDLPAYFRDTRGLVDDARMLVAADYAKGVGYDGYLKNGGQAFFQRATQAVADVWNTVLRIQPDSADKTPSERALTYYFVDEIGFLLQEKENFLDAERAYDNFDTVNPGILEAYEAVGDHFYEFGRSDRAVEEWRIAATMSGPSRERIVKKLGRHFIEVGQDLMERADGPEPPDRALENAIEAFREALSTDRTSEQAADLLTAAQVALKQKEARRTTVVQIVASAERVLKEARAQREQQLYEAAIGTFRQAVLLCESIDNEFRDQRQTADEIVGDAENGISQIMNEVLQKAEDTLDDGQRMLEEKQFDQALAAFEQIAGILTVIPNEGSPHSESKETLVDKAKEKIEEVARERVRWQEQLEQNRNQQEQQATQGAAPRQQQPEAPAAPGMMPMPMMPGMPQQGGGQQPGPMMPGMPMMPPPPAGN
jgi:tetratricopeptide (TPR) repeat protein